jgi:hypothetical protein
LQTGTPRVANSQPSERDRRRTALARRNDTVLRAHRDEVLFAAPDGSPTPRHRSVCRQAVELREAIRYI